MKFGFRTPSLRRSISARTTGRVKRAIKRAIIPSYGRKGMGLLTHPRKSLTTGHIGGQPLDWVTY